VSRGRFITLEGGEGAGKSTLARALSERLDAAGFTARTTREPGGSPKAEAIREMILAAAARVDDIDSLIRPALERGEWVICDRFIDSTRVYQGVLGKLDKAVLAELETVTISGLMPELTLILDLDPEIGLARAAKRRRPGEAIDRFEGETLAFHRNLRQAYLDIASAEPQRCAVLDATLPPEALAEAAWHILRERLPIDPEV